MHMLVAAALDLHQGPHEAFVAEFIDHDADLGGELSFGGGHGLAVVANEFPLGLWRGGGKSGVLLGGELGDSLDAAAVGVAACFLPDGAVGVLAPVFDDRPAAEVAEGDTVESTLLSAIGAALLFLFGADGLGGLCQTARHLAALIPRGVWLGEPSIDLQKQRFVALQILSDLIKGPLPSGGDKSRFTRAASFLTIR